MTSYRNQGEYLTLERQDESDTPCAVSCTGGARRLPQGFDVTPGWVHDLQAQHVTKEGASLTI